MTRSWLRTSLLISVGVAIGVAIVRAVRGGPIPAFEMPGGPGAPWPTLRPEATPDWVGPSAAPVDAELSDGPLADGPAWIEATIGPPPASHPIKAKLGSGIYHLPGMMNYERTRADRFYRTAADAETDGLRAAKR